MEEQLELSQRMILRLVSWAEVFGSFAHEIAQPLNAIMIASQVLQLKIERSLLSDAEKAFILQRLGIVGSQVNRATSIIESLRELSCEGSFEWGSMGVDGVFRKVYALMEQQFVVRGIRITVNETGPFRPLKKDLSTMRGTCIQSLAFARDLVGAIGAWHEERGIEYIRSLNVDVVATDDTQSLWLAWDRGSTRAGTWLLDPWKHIGLAASGFMASMIGGGLEVHDSGLKAWFSCE